jgi:hypothetical protein
MTTEDTLARLCERQTAEIIRLHSEVDRMREALEAVTPMFEKLMMSCGPFKEDIQILQICVAALSHPAPSPEKP